MLKLDESHNLNLGVLKHLRETHGGNYPISSADSHPDPYMRAGSYPDIVSRVWETLGGALPVDCRAIVYGTPALVHPINGVVLALAYGTAYVIRIPNDILIEAIEAGCKVERRWSNGTTTNIQELLGYGWLFGCWEKKETLWLLATYNDLLGAT
jgi:hypothetical protein